MIQLVFEENVIILSNNGTQPKALVENSLIQMLKDLNYEFIKITDEVTLIAKT